MDDSFPGNKFNTQLGPEDEAVTFHELYLQAQGLYDTAENAIRAGYGEDRTQSIVRDAAQRLITDATSLNGCTPDLGSAHLHAEMTWVEMRSFAQAISDWASLRHEPQRSPITTGILLK